MPSVEQLINLVQHKKSGGYFYYPNNGKIRAKYAKPVKTHHIETLGKSLNDKARKKLIKWIKALATHAIVCGCTIPNFTLPDGCGLNTPYIYINNKKVEREGCVEILKYIFSIKEEEICIAS